MRRDTSEAAWRKGSQIVSLVFACAWGMEYLMQPPKRTLYPAEAGIPLTLFGTLLLLFGILGLLGEIWKAIGYSKPPTPDAPYICRAEDRSWPSFVAHASLCAIYAGFFAGCFYDMVANTHLYGIRVLVAMLLLTIGHGWFAQRSSYVS